MTAIVPKLVLQNNSGVTFRQFYHVTSQAATQNTSTQPERFAFEPKL